MLSKTLEVDSYKDFDHMLLPKTLETPQIKAMRTYWNSIWSIGKSSRGEAFLEKELKLEREL